MRLWIEHQKKDTTVPKAVKFASPVYTQIMCIPHANQVITLLVNLGISPSDISLSLQSGGPQYLLQNYHHVFD